MRSDNDDEERASDNSDDDFGSDRGGDSDDLFADDFDVDIED